MYPDEINRISERLDALEKKVDKIILHMERAAGAWWFMKLMSTVAIGIATLFAFLHDKFTLK